MKFELKFGEGTEGMDDDLKKAMLNKLQEAGHAIDEPARELQRKRVDAKLAAKSRL